MKTIWFERRRLPGFDHLFADLAQAIDPDTDEQYRDKLASAHAVIAASGIFYDGPLMDSMPELQAIARTGIGVNNIDLDAATARGVAIINVPTGPTVPTAEQTMMLLLACAKNLKVSERRLRQGETRIYERHQALELAGKALGLVGFGRIARRVARMAQGFELKVLAYDPFVEAAEVEQAGVSYCSNLTGLLQLVDIVSLHLPVLADTHKIMNAVTFAQMRAGSIFINCSRGALVDEDALMNALESGHLMAAGLDVTDPEPAPANHPLLALDNVYVTPHVASATPEGRERNFVGALEQAVMVLKGERPPHLVNPEVWDTLRR